MPDRSDAAAGRRGTGAAFTLIELLVVISVIALLVGILLPALSRAKLAAAETRETSAIRQLVTAYLQYSTDNKSKVMPGYLKKSWSDPLLDPLHQIWAWDSPHESADSARLSGTMIRKYSWRLAPYLEYSLESLILDRQLYSDYRALPDSRTMQNGWQAAFAQSPSFGLNTTYVGGDARRGAFFQPSIWRWGSYYVTRVDEPTFPDRLTIFATARGDSAATPGVVVPGNHRIEGPWNALRAVDQVPVFSRWGAPRGRFDPSRSPGTYGHLDFRYFGRVITATFDGHAQSHSLEEMNDMRRWSNQATAPDWHPH